MMRRPQAFVPAAGEALETRTVPTGLGGFLGGLLGGTIGSLPAQDALAVRRDFDAFERTYVKDVRTILAPQGSTSAQIATNTTAFNTAIGTAVGTLNAAVTADLKNLTMKGPGYVTTIAGQTAALQSALALIPAPTDSTFSTVLAYDQKALQTIETAENTAAKLVASDTATGTIDSTTVGTLLKTVQTSFTAFNKSYYNAVKTDLLGTTPNTTQFPLDVAAALKTLNSSIVKALPAQLPASVVTTITTTITNDLLSPGSGTTDTSLQGTLAKIPLPNPSSWFSRFLFNLRSSFVVSGANAQVTHDLVSAINTYNSGLL